MQLEMRQRAGGLPFGVITVLAVLFLSVMMLKPFEKRESTLTEALHANQQISLLPL